MKFSVGYQLREDEESSFLSLIEPYRDHIAEVYFPWIDLPSGRGSIAESGGYINWRAQEQLLSDLKAIKKMGIKTDLLLNGNCYGEDSMSERLHRHISSVLDYLGEEGCLPDVVTTASPAVAHMIRKCAKPVNIRASVNMRIGSVKGMEYVKHLFDSFCVCRDVNRDLERLARLKEWCDGHGKQMVILANSGCMRECSYQTFHDNMVSHNEGILQRKNLSDFLPYACWNYLKAPEQRVSVLQNTWIRPEDIHHYEPYTDMIKLATRMHELPAAVIHAYVHGEYYGNLLDLFEPGFGPAFAPMILSNRRFPDDWFERTTQCSKNCEECSYCQSVYEQILVEG